MLIVCIITCIYMYVSMVNDRIYIQPITIQYRN